MSRDRRILPSLLSFAILASVIVVGASFVRGGGDEPSAGGSGQKPAAFPWIEFESPRVGDEPKVADPVAMLVRRVEALESRVASLERDRQSPTAPSPTLPHEAPNYWRSFEFNGQTIYIVPTATSNTMQGLNEGAGPIWQPSLNQTLLKYEPLPSGRGK